MTIPAREAAHFILVQTEILTGLQVFFDAPTCANSLHDESQGSRERSEDQVIRQLAWIIKTATKHEEVLPVFVAGLKPGKDGPVKEPFAFGALALAQPLPVAASMQGGCEASYRRQRRASGSLDRDHLSAGNGHGVGVAQLLEPLGQVRTVAVHGISDAPADGDVGS